MDESAAQLMGVLLVLFVLTTVLTPIARRLERRESRTEPTDAGLAAELMSVADRIEELNASPGSQAPAMRRECDRLRELARSVSG